MNILSFVDLHGSLTILSRLERKAAVADIIVCAGDSTNFENNMDHVFYRMARLGKPVLVIPGNHESDEQVKSLCQKHNDLIYLENRSMSFGEYLFIGCAGNGFANIDHHFERDTRKFGSLVIEKRKKGEIRYILITHAAPYNTRLDKIYGGHNGNRTVRKFIEKTKPDLAICGHFHENAGKEDRIGKTVVVNPGPEGKLIDC